MASPCLTPVDILKSALSLPPTKTLPLKLVNVHIFNKSESDAWTLRCYIILNAIDTIKSLFNIYM